MFETFRGKFKENRMCFFNVIPSIGDISGMACPIDVTQKWRASVGYWVSYVTLAFGLTHDLVFGFFKIKFRNSCISGIIGLIDVKQKEVTQFDAELSTWLCHLATPMTLTLNFQGQSLK